MGSQSQTRLSDFHFTPFQTPAVISHKQYKEKWLFNIPGKF